MSIETLMWLLPICFMIHDFEEIILLKSWVTRNQQYIQGRFPRLARRLLPHLQTLSTPAFALAVAEEFVILAGVTLAAVQYRLYNTFTALLIVYVAHALAHCGQSLALRKYVPATGTAILTSSYCVYALLHLQSLQVLDWNTVGLVILIIFLVGGVNLVMSLRLAAWLDPYLQAN